MRARVLDAGLLVVACAFAVSCDRTLPLGAGAGLLGSSTVVLSEASNEYDSAALETISATKTIQNTGFGVDPDTAVRRVWDPRSRTWRLFTLGRRTGRVVERRAGDTSIVREWSVALAGGPSAATNPLDLTLDASGRIWVACGGTSQLRILGDVGQETVDLSRFAAAISCSSPGRSCGNPSMSAVTYWRGGIFVALRRLRDGFEVESDAAIVRVDEGTKEAAPFLELSGVRNPSERFSMPGGPDSALRTFEAIGGPLSTPPERSGALVQVDLEVGTWRRLIDGRALNAFVVSHVLTAKDAGFAILAEYDADRMNPTRLVRFESDGKVGKPLTSSSGYQLWRVAHAAPGHGLVLLLLGLEPLLGRDRLLVSDRGPTSYGLHVFDWAGRPAGTISTLLPPYDFEVHEEP